MPPPPDEVRLLGPMIVRAAGEVRPINGQKSIGLVAMLALRAGREVPLGTIASDVWSQPRDKAVRSIRTYVSRFRTDHSVGFISSHQSGTALRIDLDPDRVDALAFRGAVDRGLSHDLGPLQRSQMLESALALWRGPALTEIADQSWAQAEIQALDEVHRIAKHELVAARLELGLHRQLCAELEIIVTEHPYDEAFWAQFMLALYRSGRQRDALQAYQQAREALLDLSLEPGPELRRLEVAILNQDPSLDYADTASIRAPATDDVALVAPETSPFVSDLTWARGSPIGFAGRSQLLEALTERIAHIGSPQVIVLEGLPGAGKTQVASALVDRLSADDVVISYGRGWGVDAGAFGLWEPILMRLRNAAGASLSAEAAADVDKMLNIKTAGDSARTSPPHAAVADLFAATAAGRNHLVVLDDLHLADPESLVLLRYLIQAQADIVVLATARSSGSGDAPHATLLDRLQNHAPIERFEVGPLGPDAIGTLAEWAEVDADPIELDRITGGNALLLTELVREMARNPVAVNSLDITPAIEDHVRRRIARVDAPTVAFLQAAALIGDRFDAALAGEACEMTIESAAAAADRLTEGEFIGGSDAPGVFDFLQPVVASAVRSLTPDAARAIRHRSIATALERRLELGRSVDMAMLGHHWAQAGTIGDLDRAVDCIEAAGQNAARRYGYETAATLYRSAISLGSTTATASRIGRLHLEVAMVENAAGDIRAAKAACLEAADAARLEQDFDLLADAAIEYGGVLTTGADHEDADALSLMLEAKAAPIDAPKRARVLSRLAELDYWMADRPTRRGWVDEAREIADQTGDPGLTAHVLLHSYWALNCPDLLNERLELLTEMDAAIQQVGEVPLLLQSGKCRLHLLLELGDVAGARALSERHERLATRLGHADSIRLGLLFQAMVAALEGRDDDMIRLGSESQRLMEAHGHRFQGRLAFELQRLPSLFFSSSMAEAIPWFRRVAELDQTRPLWNAVLAWAAAETGDFDEASMRLDLLDFPSFVSRERRVDWWPVLASATHAVNQLGDRALAQLLYDGLTPFAERNAVLAQTAFLGSVSHHLGTLAATLGNYDIAAEHLSDAQRRHLHIGARPWHALTRQAIEALPGQR